MRNKSERVADILKRVNDADYQVPLTFEGKIVKTTLVIDGPTLTRKTRRS